MNYLQYLSDYTPENECSLPKSLETYSVEILIVNIICIWENIEFFFVAFML